MKHNKAYGYINTRNFQNYKDIKLRYKEKYTTGIACFKICNF